MKSFKAHYAATRSLYSLVLFVAMVLGLAGAAYAEKDPPPPQDYDLDGGGIVNLGMVSADDPQTGLTNTTTRHRAVSIGQLGGVNPVTGEVITNAYNLLPLVARELDVDGEAFFYTNVFIAADAVIYGIIYGSGIGITNIPAAHITGSLLERPEMQTALDRKLNIDGVWTAITGNALGVTNLQQVVSILSSAVPSWDAAYAWGNHALEGYAMYEELIALSSSTNNPHQITAAQLGAYTVDDADRMISNAIVQIQSAGFIATNQAGDVSITGSFMASNITAVSFIGDGAGLTNILIENLNPAITRKIKDLADEMEDELAMKLDADGVWIAILANTEDSADLQFIVAGNSADISGLQSSIVQLQTATADTNNPHQITALQTGALPLSGGTLGGNIDMAESHRLINLPEPANDRDAITKSYLDKRLNFIPPQGDLGMGIYTNLPGN